MDSKRRHFHTFDALRFFAFFLVFLHHLPKDESYLITFFSKSGTIGVSFFFVLSGFLITYILLFEKENNRLSIKNFFTRRALRIWPLFYSMILFAYLTPYLLKLLHLSISNNGYEPNLLTSVFFLENYKMIFMDNVPNTPPLVLMWSLCVEEHFYLIWGVLFYFVSLKRIPIVIGTSIIMAFFFRLFYNYYKIPFIDIFTNIDFFAFGAIPAYILLYKPTIITRIEKIPLTIKYILVFITLILIFAIPNTNMTWIIFIAPTVFGLLFSTIIIVTLTNSNALCINNNSWISKLGIYTYGLYLFHTIVVNIIYQITKIVPFEISWFLVAIASLTISILISMASYHLFEKQFLKLKKYF